LREGEMVMEFRYQNSVPLYVDEEMKICVRRNPEREEKFDVWIEGVGGGFAVKGSAIVGKGFDHSTKRIKGTVGDE
jgi:hypothetical protein